MTSRIAVRRGAGRSGRAGRSAALLPVLLWALLHGGPAKATPAFPGAEGFGADSVGGRGGSVFAVTTLEDSCTPPFPSGSLRSAVSQIVPRIIVFRVAGTIELQCTLSVNWPRITIAGQTAPGGGIALRLAGDQTSPAIMIGCSGCDVHDVIIRHLRVRPGPNDPGIQSSARDAITITADTRNVILDHVSASWAVDENVDIAGAEVTVQRSILSEGLHCSTHHDGCHSTGLMISDQGEDETEGISLHHNLFAHNIDRNPRLSGNAVVDAANNVVYDRGSTVADAWAQSRANFLENLYVEGQPWPPQKKEILLQPQLGRTTVPGEHFALFLSGNVGPSRPDPSLPETALVGTTLSPGDYRIDTPHAAPGVTLQPASSLLDALLDDVGATLPSRDAVDARVVDDVRNGTGGLIDDPSEVGGHPVLDPGTPPADADGDLLPDAWEIAHGLEPGVADDPGEDAEGDGYTLIEEYLNGTDPGEVDWIPAPRSVTSQSVPGGVMVGWTQPSPPAGVTLTGSTITVAPDGLTGQAAAGQTSGLVSGLEDGATYTAWVVAEGNTAVSPPSARSQPAAPPLPIVTTAAGNGLGAWGNPFLFGDGGPAARARVASPWAVAFDAGGNLVIADTHNNLIRSVDPAGTILRLAGTGIAGFDGDGPALARRLNAPMGVAVDAQGTVYFSDTFSQRVRRIEATGSIATVAGTGAAGVAGDGGPAESAELWSPRGLAFDAAGDLYVADCGNDRVRRIEDLAGTPTIGTVAGGGSADPGDGGAALDALLPCPNGLAFDAQGDLYVAGADHRVRRVDAGSPNPIDWTITTAAGTGTSGYAGDGGPATEALLGGVQDVAVDAFGNLYVSDTLNQVVRRVGANGVIRTVAGAGPPAGYAGDTGLARDATLGNPRGLAVDAWNDVYVADSANFRVRRLHYRGGLVFTAAGSGDAGFSGDDVPDGAVRLNHPAGVATDDAGNVYVADQWNNRVRKVATDGTITTVAGGSSGACHEVPATSCSLIWPMEVAIDGDHLFVVQTLAHTLRMVDLAAQPPTIETLIDHPAGSPNHADGVVGDALIWHPGGLTVGGDGDLYLADKGNQRIKRVDTDHPDPELWTISTVAGTGDLGFNGDGPATSTLLMYPTDVAFHAAGGREVVYIADYFNHRVRELDLETMQVTTVAGGGASDPGDGGPALDAALANPKAVAVDEAGNLLIAQDHRNRIRRVDTSGESPADWTIETILGDGTASSVGDGGPAADATVHHPSDLAVHTGATLYVVEKEGHRLRRIVGP